MELHNQHIARLVYLARRYADLRSTYVTGELNRMIDMLLDCGVEIETDETLSDPEGMFVVDGMFGAWRNRGWDKSAIPSLRGFEMSPNLRNLTNRSMSNGEGLSSQKMEK